MEWAVLQGLSDKDRTEVLRAARRRRFTRNEVVFHEGDPADTAHLLAKGRVSVTITTPLGDKAMLAVLGPGAVFGELALLAEEPVRSATITALEATETLSLSREQFEGLRREHRTADRFLVQACATALRDTSQRLLEAFYVPADTRIVRRVQQLAGEYSDGRPETVIPLTQEALASMAGTARPTANRVLRALESDGLVRIGRGRITVLDAEGLRNRAR